MENKDRNIKLDILKGIAIILVVVGHVLQSLSYNTYYFFDNKLVAFIYSFHMPLFALISGYLFYYSKNKDKKHVLISKSKSLLYPVLVFNIIYYYMDVIIDVCMHGGEFVQLLNAGWTNYIGRCWFLWSLFACIFVKTIVDMCAKKECQRLILSILLIPVLYVFPNGENNFFLYVFFIIGYYYNQIKEIESIKKISEVIKPLSTIMYPISMIWWNNNFYVYTTGMTTFVSSEVNSQIIWDLCRIGYGLLGSIFVIYIVELGYKFIKNKIIFNKLSMVGTISLEIYLIQMIVLERFFNNFYIKIFNQNMANFMYSNKLIFYCGIVPTITTLILLIIIIIIKILNKKGISKYLFGR